jgi:hypothetical protein
MSVKSVRQALEVAVGTWSAANANFPIAWENVPYKPAQNTAYLRLNLLPAETENPSLGDAHKRYVGILQASIYLKEGNGTAAATTTADSLLNYFARGHSFTVGQIVVRVLNSPSINPALNVEGWYILPVSIRYQADVF